MLFVRCVREELEVKIISRRILKWLFMEQLVICFLFFEIQIRFNPKKAFLYHLDIFLIQSSQSEVAGSNTGSPTMHDPGALRDVCLFCVYHET